MSKEEGNVFLNVTRMVRDDCFEFLSEINNQSPSLFELIQVQLLGKRAYISFSPKGIQEYLKDQRSQ